MSVGFVILCTIALISLFINYRFIKLYVLPPPNYPVVKYHNLNLRTGDLLFFQDLKSIHTWITNSTFSHVAMIVVYNSIPYCLECTELTNVSMTNLQERLLKHSTGYCYIRQLNNHYILDKFIHGLLSWAKNIRYPTAHKLIKTVVNSCVVGHELSDDKELHCAYFIIYALRQMRILNGREKINCNPINFLTTVVGYTEMKKIE